MTTEKDNGSGSTTEISIDILIDQLHKLQNAPPFKRAGLAADASATIVVALRDLDRRIQQLEAAGGEEQHDRDGDLPVLR